MTIDMVTATKDSFAPYVGQRFTVEAPDGEIALTLDNIKVFEGSTVRDNHLEVDGVVYPPRKAFALTFEGPREPVLASQTYPVRHPELGTLALFLSGFRQDHDCMLYESVFN